MKFDVKDLSLATRGKLKIEWAAKNMPVLRLIKDRFSREKPLKNIVIGALLHVTAETANLLETLRAGGATLSVCAANTHSTQDDVAASLVADYQTPVFAIKGEDGKTYDKHIRTVLATKPVLFVDDGADLTATYHLKLENLSKEEQKEQLKKMFGASEETTTGMLRMRAMEKERILQFPIVGVNDSQTKHLFDNRYGTGQSTVDAIMRSTDVLFAGKAVVVCGYGWCGRGVATRAKGMGANVIVTEVDPVKALEGLMDGYQVMEINRAVKNADIVITATGNTDVVTTNTIEKMKDGVILANAGHFYVEFDYYGLVKIARKRRKMRNFVEEFTLKSGRKINVLGEGRLINLVAASGHPADVMDMSFANQALAAEWLVKNKGNLVNKVYLIPEKLDKEIASLKLQAMGVKIDKLTIKQKKYLSSWE